MSAIPLHRAFETSSPLTYASHRLSTMQFATPLQIKSPTSTTFGDVLADLRMSLSPCFRHKTSLLSIVTCATFGEGYVFTPVWPPVSYCLCCLVNRITEKVVSGFLSNFGMDTLRMRKLIEFWKWSRTYSWYILNIVSLPVGQSTALDFSNQYIVFDNYDMYRKLSIRDAANGIFVGFCASWPWPLIFWSQNKWISGIYRGTFLCQVWWSWLAAAVFEISRW